MLLESQYKDIDSIEYSREYFKSDEELIHFYLVSNLSIWKHLSRNNFLDWNSHSELQKLADKINQNDWEIIGEDLSSKKITKEKGSIYLVFGFSDEHFNNYFYPELENYKNISNDVIRKDMLIEFKSVLEAETDFEGKPWEYGKLSSEQEEILAILKEEKKRLDKVVCSVDYLENQKRNAESKHKTIVEQMAEFNYVVPFHYDYDRDTTYYKQNGKYFPSSIKEIREALKNETITWEDIASCKQIVSSGSKPSEDKPTLATVNALKSFGKNHKSLDK